jgi:hypothetical protein
MSESTFDNKISIQKVLSIEPIKHSWDTLVTDYYQTYDFSCYLETYNKCSQRYYVLYDCEVLKAGAILYTLPVNVLTFSQRKLSLLMNVIGVAASVDSSGLLGEAKYFNIIIDYILAHEKGVTLCLNYDSTIIHNQLIQLNALPTIVLKHNFNDVGSYLNNMRHHYRRRAIHAMNKFEEIVKTYESCNCFTDVHYRLYINVMEKSKTKLELLSKDFFTNLPNNFMLTSYYNIEKVLLSWHITCEYKDVFSFLFGGINYEKRDEFHAYYNNLIGIIHEGIDKGYKIINLGQTPEIPKMRLGGECIPKNMFIYHSNIMIRFIFKILRKQIEYKCNSETLMVFKK